MAKSSTKQSKQTASKRSTWQQNKWVLLLMGLVLLGLAYGFASWAIDSGRWSAYGLTFASVFIGMRYCFRAAKLAIRN